jgi:AcrR family transcriptional regulator
VKRFRQAHSEEPAFRHHDYATAEAADWLFYERGFEATSFAGIAAVVGLSRGNFYYHFKTKDETRGAVIAHRLSKTRAMLDAWEVEGKTPTDRIRSFINTLIMNQSQIMAPGCPVGTLCNELASSIMFPRTEQPSCSLCSATGCRASLETLATTPAPMSSPCTSGQNKSRTKSYV